MAVRRDIQSSATNGDDRKTKEPDDGTVMLRLFQLGWSLDNCESPATSAPSPNWENPATSAPSLRWENPATLAPPPNWENRPALLAEPREAGPFQIGKTGRPNTPQLGNLVSPSR